MITSIVTTVGPAGQVVIAAGYTGPARKRRIIQTDHGPQPRTSAYIKLAGPVDPRSPICPETHAAGVREFVGTFYPRTGGGCWIACRTTNRSLLWIHADPLPSPVVGSSLTVTATTSDTLVCWL